MQRLQQPARHLSSLICCGLVIVIVVTAGCTGVLAGTSSGNGTPEDLRTAGASPVTITDSQGAITVLPAPARRIICQNGDAAEMLVALGAGDRIVGVADTTIDDPVLMPHLPHAASIGDWQTPNIEKILALEPDVILTYSGMTKNAGQLVAANLTLVPVDSYKIPDLGRDAGMLGRLAGRTDRVVEYTRFNEKYLSLVRDRVQKRAGSEPIRVYVEGYSDYSVHATGSGGDHLLRLLNATNIAGSIRTQSATVSPEWVIEQDPDVIIKIAMDPAKYESLDTVRQSILSRPGLSRVRAVRENRVYVINGDVISSPRGVVGLLYAAKALYPEEFADVMPEDALAEYAREFVSGTDRVGTFSPVL